MRADWYFDFISPFAFLQLPRVLALRARVEIVPVPIVFGAVLAHHGQLGPAEIAAKRAFTYRYVQWQADRAGIALRFPPAHPFNPLAALRLCVAAGGGWDATGRALGAALVESHGYREVAYENKGGAAGANGLAQFLKDAPGNPHAMLMMGAVMIGGLVSSAPLKTPGLC